jgi:phosphoribosyl-ATP pyrophosphohydrolase
MNIFSFFKNAVVKKKDVFISGEEFNKKYLNEKFYIISNKELRIHDGVRFFVKEQISSFITGYHLESCIYIIEVTVPNNAKVFEIKTEYYGYNKTDKILINLDNKILLENWDMWNDYDFCLKVVQKNGNLLKYVKEQTTDICLAAVQQNGWALEYVKEETPEICIAAVKQNGSAFFLVKNQTPEICMVAVKSGCAMMLSTVKEQTLEICIAAVQNDREEILYIKNKEHCNIIYERIRKGIFKFDDHSERLKNIIPA